MDNRATDAGEPSPVEALSERVDRLERECRLLRRGARRWKRAGGLVLLGGIALMVAGGDDPTIEARPPGQAEGGRAGETRGDPEALYGAQVETARRALRIMDRATALGIQSLYQPDQEYFWSLHLLEGQIYLSLGRGEPKTDHPQVFLSLPGIKPNPERLAAFEAHFRRMKAWEGKTRNLSRRGSISALDLTLSEFRRLPAEAWLARARLQEQGPEAPPNPGR
jgi:hypothetical protein